MKIKILIIALLMPVVCAGQSPAGTTFDPAIYRNSLYLGNIYYGSNSPTAISRTPFDIMSIAIDYQNQKGGFHSVNEPYDNGVWNGEVYGVKGFEKITFEGSIGYANESLKDKQGKSIIYASGDNPFFLWDPVRADYSMERFILNGGLSYRISQKWHAGLRAEYNSGVMADQSDPRCITKGIRFMLNVGIDYTLGKFTLGVSGRAERLSEKNSFTKIGLVTDTDPVYLFKGLTTPQFKDLKTSISYIRNYAGYDYGGNIQLVWDSGSKASNFIEAGYSLINEDAVDGGGSYVYRGGDYDAIVISVRDRLMLRGNSTIHNITVDAKIKSIEGTWYTQEEKSDAGDVYYIIKDKAITHTDNVVDASISYRLDLLKNKTPHFTFNIRGTYFSSEMLNYPMEYLQEYRNMHIGADATKYFNLRKTTLSFTLLGGYKMNLAGDADFSGIKTTGGYSAVAGYFEPEFAWHTAGYYLYGGIVQFHMPARIRDRDIGLGMFVKTSFTEYTDGNDLLNSTNRLVIAAGINITL